MRMIRLSQLHGAVRRQPRLRKEDQKQAWAAIEVKGIVRETDSMNWLRRDPAGR